MLDISGQKKIRRGAWAGVLGFLAILAICIAGYVHFFGAPQKRGEPQQFTVPLGSTQDEIAAKLKDGGYIESAWAFRYALGDASIEPGAYKISTGMSVRQLARIFKGGPYMKWVVIPEGLRKEQIAEILAAQLGWNETETAQWITVDTAPTREETEGVYFPDTYLIPVSESPADVAARLRARFNEKFKPFAEEAARQNIKWDTVLKIASIVQREAAGADDMPLVAGILWNRLLAQMPLQADATVQYARDDIAHYGKARTDAQPSGYMPDGGWWAPIVSKDTAIDSPYNTYLHAGLPPHPIDNPGAEAIAAVLEPQETECIYYIHDAEGQIHCAATFEEHRHNIETYLK